MRLRQGELGELLCPLPECEGTLYVEISGCLGLGVATPEWPNGGTPEKPLFGDMNTTGWSVVCDGGHTIDCDPQSDDYNEFRMSTFLAKFGGV